MALSRRLFLRGALVATAAPAIVKAANIMPIVVPKPLDNLCTSMLYDFEWSSATDTRRMVVHEPAWQELERGFSLHPHQRETLKRILFAQRYGTRAPFPAGNIPKGPRIVDLDFSRLEARVLSTYLNPMR